MQEIGLNTSLRRIYDILEEIKRYQGDIKVAIGVLETNSHPPAACPLGDRVRNIELAGARQLGMFTVIGVVVSFAATTIITLIARAWR